MKRGPALIGATVALLGCGGGSSEAAGGPARAAPGGEAGATTGSTARPRGAAAATGALILVRPSRFGPMLFDSRRQAIYIFERDTRGRSNCYGECARLWPPVYTRGRPRAGTGVRKSLLGTTRRRGGRLQVTYAGKPLYFYAHERPRQVLCHNVHLNGGFWWVIGPDGKRRP